MELEYQYTREDFFDFNKAYCAYGLRKRLWLIFLFTLLIPSFSNSGKRLDIWTYITTSAIVFAFFVILSYFVPLVIGYVRIKKMLEKKHINFEKNKLTVQNDGLHVESASKTVTRLWESMKSGNSINGFIYIQLADKTTLMFPERFFLSHADKANFLGIVQSRVTIAKGIQKAAAHNKRKNPSIPWIIACLIPGIGAIMSVVILADGASRYKEKWYILLGVGGILFTVLTVVVVLKPINSFLEEQFAPFAQMNVNTLMKDVEFYKMKHGEYPDSLKQVEKDDPSAPIYDAIASAQLNSNKTIQYNYRRVGNRYYLFSSGLDGIPGTTDDIYPQVSKSDSGKFGLIHK